MSRLLPIVFQALCSVHQRLSVGQDLAPSLAEVSKNYQEWKTVNNKLETLSSQNSDHQAKLDLLRFQTQELDELQLTENEATQLDEEHLRLSNAGHLLESSCQSVMQLYDADEQSVYAHLSSVLVKLEEGRILDSSLQEPLDMLLNAQIQVQEAAELLRRYQDNVALDPGRLDWVNQRLSSLHELSRKHQTSPEKLFNKWQSLHAQLSELSGDEYNLDALQDKLKTCTLAYSGSAEKLCKTRKAAAKQLSAGVTEAMQQLGMEGGKFVIEFETNEVFANHGTDSINFMVSANPGQPLKALHKVASGGELSRISLAIQMIAAQRITLPALIFDEVDSGIGGGIAEVVGQQLRQLGKNRQVLCVTHLPQVASQAHNHYKVTKIKAKDATTTGMLVLNDSQRIEELARMMGGVEITQRTLNLAEEMLAN
jgi:DNA repair protein RecN (Recombination protein N)